jgi:hypothetical protein
MKPRTFPGMLSVSLLIAVLLAPVAVGSPTAPRAQANLPVSLSFNPDPVTAGSQTQIQISISGGSGPYYIWFNGSIPGCTPPQQPIQQNTSSNSYSCNPTSPGTYPVSLGVADSAGNHGSAGGTLTVQSSGGSGGTGGSGTGGNGTGGIDLSFLNNLLPIIMVTGFLFLGSTVAIAVSAVALAILVPRRLKQIRKALEGQPMKAPKTEAPATPPPPKEQPPNTEL